MKDSNINEIIGWQHTKKTINMTHEQISNIKTATVSATVGAGSTFAIDWNHIAERGIETGILALINTVVAVVAGLSVRWVWKKFIKD